MEVREWLTRNVPEKEHAELSGWLRGRAFVLDNARPESAPTARKNALAKRRRKDLAARRAPRAERKRLLAAALDSVRHDQLGALREAWRVGGERALAPLAGPRQAGGGAAGESGGGKTTAPPVDLGALASREARLRKTLRSVDLRGAEVRVLVAGGDRVKRNLTGTLLDLSSNALVLVPPGSAKPRRYPLKGTKLRLEALPTVVFWGDAL